MDGTELKCVMKLFLLASLPGSLEPAPLNTQVVLASSLSPGAVSLHLCHPEGLRPEPSDPPVVLGGDATKLKSHFNKNPKPLEEVRAMR